MFNAASASSESGTTSRPAFSAASRVPLDPVMKKARSAPLPAVVPAANIHPRRQYILGSIQEIDLRLSSMPYEFFSNAGETLCGFLFEFWYCETGIPADLPRQRFLGALARMPVSQSGFGAGIVRPTSLPVCEGLGSWGPRALARMPVSVSQSGLVWCWYCETGIPAGLRSQRFFVLRALARMPVSQSGFGSGIVRPASLPVCEGLGSWGPRHWQGCQCHNWVWCLYCETGIPAG